MSLTKIVIILALTFLVYLFLSNYLQNKPLYAWYSFDLTIIRGLSLLVLNIYFLTLVFIIKIKVFRKLYLFLIIFGIIAWNVSHFDTALDLNILPNAIDDFLEITLFLSTSIVAPGLLILIVFYIKKFTARFEGSFIGRYHLHEGLFGIILVGVSVAFFAIRTYLTQIDIFLKEFKVFLAVVMILLYFFLFFGGFFIFRDFNDIIHFKFIKKMSPSQKKPTENHFVFNSMNLDNLSFFSKSKLYIFPLGILLTQFSFSMVIYSTKFIPRDVLSSQETINLGYLISFLAGSLIGFDWVRVFKRFYPIQYEEIESKIIELQKKDI